jgi:hypothetical protein
MNKRVIIDSLSVARNIVLKASIWQKAQEGAYVVTKRAERVPEVNELRQEIKSLGVAELDYFSEGLDCIQYAQASRAAIVLGWTGFIDLLQNKIGKDNYDSLNAILKTAFHGVYKKKPRIATKQDLCDFFDDAALLEVGKKLGFFDKHVHTQLNAMRDERNNCAHVQEYAVTVRIALGFYAKLIKFLPYTL